VNPHYGASKKYFNIWLMKRMHQIFCSKKGKSLVIILWIIFAIAIIAVTFWLNNGDFKDFGRLLISTPVLVLLLSLLCILVISAYRILTLVFVPVFFLSIGIFLIVTSIKENGEISFLGKLIIDNYEIGLFSAGTTVASLGIAFLALFISRLKSKEKLSERSGKEHDACKGKATELESSMNRLNERIEINKDVKNEVKENDA